jgi:hypothetical protein
VHERCKAETAAHIARAKAGARAAAYEDAAREQQKASQSRVDATRTVERRDAVRARAAADAQAAADNAKANWEEHTKSATRDLTRRNSGDGTYTRVPISTLTYIIERRVGVDGKTRAAFYTEVATCLVVQAIDRCTAHKMDVQKPKPELEQATNIMTEVDKMLIANKLDSKNLLAAVAKA